MTSPASHYCWGCSQWLAGELVNAATRSHVSVWFSEDEPGKPELFACGPVVSGEERIRKHSKRAEDRT